jgi:hypothetical protein
MDKCFYFLKCRLSVCPYVSVAPVQLEKFHSHLILKSFCIIGRCVINIRIVAPDVVVFPWSPKIQNCDFLQNMSKGFVYNSLIYGDHL